MNTLLNTDNYSGFIEGVQNKDIKSANTALMKELGSILVKQKGEFVHLLNDSGIKVSINDSDAHLISKFIDNTGKNKKLLLGASLLINMHNRQLGFNGKEEISDEGVKGAYMVMQSSFCGEDHSNAGGILGAIGGIVQGGVGIANKMVKDKNATTNLVAAKQQAKAAMVQQVLAQRQAQLDAAHKAAASKAKLTKILVISGIGIVVIGGIIGTIIYLKKRKK